MANPFAATFASECTQCGRDIMEGDTTFAHEDEFICEQCAEDAEIVCPECGKYKKPQFDACFECHEDEDVTGGELDVW